MTEKKAGLKPGLMILVVILAIVAIVAFAFISYHNRFVKADETINQAWAQVQTQYQRRADLIPNLVETVKGYASYEEQVLKDITGMRSRYNDAKTPEEYEQADQDFQRAINIVVEAYPELKANENFLALQAELAGTENRIAVARRDFNNVVADYNRSVRTFPGNFFAKLYGFSVRDMFEAQPGADTVPSVGF
ncbi:MAG TPA: LemA family protein [Clostridia bacterium]|nr:LemA family protein [Clostridia bacterium]